jgi:hypothetical protein
MTDKEVDTDAVFTAAEERDVRADDRDFAANRRDMAANLKAFLDNVDDADAFEARKTAAKDRQHSQGDRAASKQDRHTLGNVPLASDEREEAFTQRITSAVERLEAASARENAAESRDLEDGKRKGDTADPTT